MSTSFNNTSPSIGSTTIIFMKYTSMPINIIEEYIVNNNSNFIIIVIVFRIISMTMMMIVLVLWMQVYVSIGDLVVPFTAGGFECFAEI